MKRALIYCSKVWLTSAAASPALYLCLYAVGDKQKIYFDYGRLFKDYPFLVIAFLGFSFLQWLITLFILKKLFKTKKSFLQIKIMISLIIVLLLGGASLMTTIDNSFRTLATVIFWLSSAIPNVVFIWIFKLRSINTTVTSIQPST